MKNNKNKLMILLISIFIIQYSILNSQDTWIQTYSPFYIGDGWYDVEDVIICQDGGYAVNGTFVDYDAEMGIEWAHWGFLMKTDNDGNFLWAKADTVSFMYENNSLAFVETSDSGFISAVSGGNLIKRDSSGNREWVINGDFGINSMCNTNDGNIILGGCQNLNIALRKIDEDGNTIWTQVYQIDDDYSICKSIIQTQNGGYALTGYLDYEGRADADIIVMKTDDYGDSLWTRTYDGYGLWDTGKSITEDSSGNIMVAGEIDNPNSTGFLWYLDGEGNTIWTQEVDSSIGYSHDSILSISDNLFVAYCYKGNRESKIYSFDNYYNVQWQGIFDGYSGLGDRSMDNEGKNYLCLLWEVGGYLENNIGIAKTDSIGQIFTIDEHETPHINEITLSNYPNPFNTSTTISYNLPFNIKNPVIEIYNIIGQCIRKFKIENEKCKMNELVWDGKNQYKNQVSSGVYLYRLKTDDCVSKTKKMILTK
jgi:hypothetical protein